MQIHDTVIPAFSKPFSFCTYKFASHLHIPHDFKSRSFCTYAPIPANPFRFCTYKNTGYPRLKSQTHGFSALTHSGRRHNPSAGFSFAPLRVFAPLPARRGGRETPEVALHPKPQIPKFYRIDPQALRNSILRNSHIPKGLDIPPGGGGTCLQKQMNGFCSVRSLARRALRAGFMGTGLKPAPTGTGPALRPMLYFSGEDK